VADRSPCTPAGPTLRVRQPVASCGLPPSSASRPLLVEMNKSRTNKGKTYDKGLPNTRQGWARLRFTKSETECRSLVLAQIKRRRRALQHQGRHRDMRQHKLRKLRQAATRAEKNTEDIAWMMEQAQTLLQHFKDGTATKLLRDPSKVHPEKQIARVQIQAIALSELYEKLAAHLQE
jgi:hypothetical protein